MDTQENTQDLGTEQTDSKELWRMAGVKNKVDTVVSLGGNVRFVWILASCTVLLAALLFLLIPNPNPAIQKLFIKGDYVVASSGEDAIFYASGHKESKIQLPFEPTSISYDGINIAISSVSKGKISVLDKQGKQIDDMDIASPFCVSYLSERLFLATPSEVSSFKRVKWDAPNYKRCVALVGTYDPIIVDYDGFYSLDGSGSFVAHPFMGKAMAVCAGMKGSDIIVGFNDLTFAVYSPADGKKIEEGKLPPWVTKEFVISGDSVACSYNSTLRIGKMTESKPQFEGDAWEGK